MTARPKPTREKDAGHRMYVRQLPCIACMVEGRVTFGVDPAHVSYLAPKGLGSKVGDQYVVPLCRAHHDDQHDTKENVWWARLGVRPRSLCEDLVHARPSVFNGEQVIRDFAERARRMPKLVRAIELTGGGDPLPERVTIQAHLSGAPADADGNVAVILPTTTGTVRAHVSPDAIRENSHG